ncbi:flagellar biosynthesis protein FlhB [Luminiphilus sp.]|nr:flagellar biosynthesis protein FlhB [Luminiphilus sp.]MDA8797417.1 flagellar biosynthesis protein FlhB [Luminiphilus sp.]MDB2378411.1 flagellar biosynthesis protein FlhB [Luminiphilus sp.]MDB2511062.1 flagellar biosynthesis protein FlhB [Luminiphilus sp.]
MAEEQTGQERSEEPTAKRLSEARKKGQVARSRELNTLLVMLVSALTLWLFSASAMTGFVAIVSEALSPNGDVLRDPELIPVHFMQVMMSALVLIAPFLAITVVAALAGPALMGGMLFSAEAIAFKAEKLDPIKGLGRVFSTKGLIELVKALLKFFLVLGVAALIYKFLERDVMSLITLDVREGIARSGSMIMVALVLLSATLVLIAAIDVPFQLWSHNKQMRMTKQEIKDESKETDGRPEVKSRIRQLQHEASQRRMLQDVPDADVVITNPTHFSVALKYDKDGSGAPRVVAKGQDLIAFKIRSIAMEHDVAIYEEPPLARALHGTTEIGDEIPGPLFLAVARVLAYVYHLRQSTPTDYIPRPAPVELPSEFAEYH